MSGRPTEEVVNEVHEYLTTIGNDLREGRIDLDDLVVHKVSHYPVRQWTLLTRYIYYASDLVKTRKITQTREASPTFKLRFD